MKSIASLLDKAKARNGIPSDYKLALAMGISHTALINYRQGKTLPDARILSKLCDLSGDDSELLACQFEAARAKSDEARELWSRIARRLEFGTANLSLVLAAAIFAIALCSPVGTFAEEVHFGEPSSVYYVK